MEKQLIEFETEEKLVEIETSKLAKEKGFPYYGGKCYYQNEIWLIENLMMFREGTLDMTLCFPAPTQTLLQKWLREVHNIHISVEPKTYEPDTDYISEIIMLPRNFLTYRGKTYEESLETALKSALILI